MNEIAVEDTSGHLMNALLGIFKMHAEDCNPDLPDQSVPAAPNSATFSATKKGTVEFRKNPVVHDHGFSKLYNFAVLFGTAVPNHVECEKDLWGMCLDEIQVPPNMYAGEMHVFVKCSDERTVTIRRHRGTAYNGIYVKLS